ncbi:MAG: flavodoxin domain-containing protein [Micrococcaceae bacterium]|nr:flavodoxin domain-containing protein [Micrococcaceae bacterium]MDN5904659.1 flavodoxin domain-containing protein [Micrococcaceae bacterium]
MRTVAIVYYGRHGPSRAYAQALENALRGAGNLAEQIQVRDAAANDVVFYDGLVLVGPPLFGRLHGLALARALAPERHSAVVVLGGNRPAEHYRKLFRPAERPSISFFQEQSHQDTSVVFSTVAPVLDWARTL